MLRILQIAAFAGRGTSQMLQITLCQRTTGPEDHGTRGPQDQGTRATPGPSHTFAKKNPGPPEVQAPQTLSPQLAASIGSLAEIQTLSFVPRSNLHCTHVNSKRGSSGLNLPNARIAAPLSARPCQPRATWRVYKSYAVKHQHDPGAA